MMKLILNLRDDPSDHLTEYALKCAVQMFKDQEGWSNIVGFNYYDIETGELIYKLTGKRNKGSVSITDNVLYD